MLRTRLPWIGVYRWLWLWIWLIVGNPGAGLQASPATGGVPIAPSVPARCEGGSDGGAQALRLVTAPQTIADIQAFLEACPTADPAFTQISTDFAVRRNGLPITTPSCTPPISSLSIAEWTDELIVLQGLRTMYYMDRGGSGHLPWSPGTLYDWVKSKIRGIDIRDGSGSFCCPTYDDGLYIAVGAQNDFNRDFDRGWKGISGNIGLYAHETRHVDGFFHSSCCGIAGGCDEVFDTNSLSAYGTQWWLNMLWLEGGIDVGWGCLSPAEVSDITNWHLGAANNTFRGRFCTNQPSLLTVPAEPGGGCAPPEIFADGFESGNLSQWSGAAP